jgi:predicted nucleotidyltransferase
MAVEVGAALAGAEVSVGSAGEGRVAAGLAEAGDIEAMMDKEKDLNELVARLKQGAGPNLNAVVLYGSAVHNDLREHSDLNVLCLLDRLDGAILESLRPVGIWWWRKGHPPPLVFTLAELRNSADVFSIELLDMKARRRMLEGADFLADLEVPMTQHKLQVERELRTNVIRLRQSFLRYHGRRSELAELLIASGSSFGTLFRHALIALGQEAPNSAREAVDRLAKLLGLNAAPFHLVLDLREGKSASGEMNLEAIFGPYLDLVTRVAEEIDRRLAV